MTGRVTTSAGAPAPGVGCPGLPGGWGARRSAGASGRAQRSDGCRGRGVYQESGEFARAAEEGGVGSVDREGIHAKPPDDLERCRDGLGPVLEASYVAPRQIRLPERPERDRLHQELHGPGRQPGVSPLRGRLVAVMAEEAADRLEVEPLHPPAGTAPDEPQHPRPVRPDLAYSRSPPPPSRR